MLDFIRKILTKNIGLKFTALILALALWFYIVNELKTGTEEERRFLNSVMPKESMIARRLSIMPMFIGKPRNGYTIDPNKAVVVPEYCIVVGTKEMLGKIRFVYTQPIDTTGVSKTFTQNVALNPVSSGIFMEETMVQVTVQVDKIE